MSDTTSILAGLKVLDVGTFIFGPAAATVLADFGADVIKVEAPGIGDPYRYLYMMPPMPVSDFNYGWLLTARNKRSIALDLRHETAREVLDKLVREADVFVTNYQPSVAEKLGVTYERVSALNPRLVYAHATGYGELGSEAEKPGYDATAWWARSGLMDLIRDAGADPALSMPGMGDHAGAMALFGGIMLALYQRDRTGRGTKVSSSLMANGVWANGFLSQAVLCGAKALRPACRRDTKNALANRYRTRDGRWLFLAVILEDRDWPRVPPALGRPELANDPRFATTAARHANALALVELLDSVFAEKTLAEWREMLDRHEITFGVVAELADLASDPQMACNDVFVDLDLGQRGTGRTINSPIWLAGEHKVPAREAPAIGQHTDEVLHALGYDSAEIGRLRQSKAVA